ncbi:hypothetical protein [Streptomyces sp. NPDC055134]
MSPPKVVGYVAVASVTSPLATVVGRAGGGRLSDRLGGRRPFVVCSATLLGIGLPLPLLLLLLLLDVPFAVLLVFVAIAGLDKGDTAVWT